MVIKTVSLYIAGFIVLFYFVSFTVSADLPAIFKPLLYFNLFGLSCWLPFVNWIFVWSHKMKIEVLEFYCRKRKNEKNLAFTAEISQSEINSAPMEDEMDVSRENFI